MCVFTDLLQLWPSAFALQRHPPSEGEQSPTLPPGSHSHGLRKTVKEWYAGWPCARGETFKTRAGRM